MWRNDGWGIVFSHPLLGFNTCAALSQSIPLVVSQCATGAAEATCPQRTFLSAFQEGGTKAVTAHSAWRSLEMCDICFVMKQFLRWWSWKLETWFSFHPSASLGEEAGELGFRSSIHEVDGTSLSVVIIFTLNWKKKKKYRRNAKPKGCRSV